MSPRRTAPGAFRWSEWGTATDDPRSRVLDHHGAMIFTGSTVRRAGDDPADPPGRVVDLVDPVRVIVAWACGAVGTEDATALRAVARPCVPPGARGRTSVRSPADQRSALAPTARHPGEPIA